MLRNIANAFVELTQKVFHGADSYVVQETTTQSFEGASVIESKNELSLYAIKINMHTAVLHCPNHNPKAFIIFRIIDRADAESMFQAFYPKLAKLISCNPKELLTVVKLQALVDVIKDNTTYPLAHIMVGAHLHQYLECEIIINSLRLVDEKRGKTVGHMAVEKQDVECLKKLMEMKVDLCLVDFNLKTPIHYAAQAKDVQILELLLTSPDASKCMNSLNDQGESALHMACTSDLSKNVALMLNYGVNPMLSGASTYPIHAAVTVNSVSCVSLLLKNNPKQIGLLDSKLKASPLHWATSKDMISLLCENGANLEEVNSRSETALLTKLRENNYNCCLKLLIIGSSSKVIDSKNNGPLHIAIELDNPELVQMLIVFGCDLNVKNKLKISPRHKAAGSMGQNSDLILHYLHSVGAMRCNSGRKDCASGCAHNGTFNGKSIQMPFDEFEPNKGLMEICLEKCMSDIKLRKGLMKEKKESIPASYSYSNCDLAGEKGDKVLCLDGGGIRGLVLMQILLLIEERTGKKITDLFDWIAGTSTGGILALSLLTGKTLVECRAIYFDMKEHIFKGKRPYDANILEEFYKELYGEHTMLEYPKPKVIVPAVLADRLPCRLHLFRNYDVPGLAHQPLQPKDEKFQSLPLPKDQVIWQAARSTGAAPTYFRASGRFIDGGLMSNNPTLDMLTEINLYNMGLISTNKEGDIKPIHLVVSIGTGRNPEKIVNTCDVYRPEGIFELAEVFFGAKNLGDMLVTQATQTEGQVVERARAWCSMIGVPYFRFSPLLSDTVDLDCLEDSKLINMLWETKCYLHSNAIRVDQLVDFLVN